MAFWNTLGIAPTTNEDEIGYAYACAVCRAIDSSEGDALRALLHSLAEARAAAVQPLRRSASLADAAGSAQKDEGAASPASSPHRDEGIAQLALLFQRALALAESRADENAWLEFTASPAFLARQDDPHFIAWLEWLCASPSPAMASALYTAYGFASSRALGLHPASGRLQKALMAYSQLPADDIPPLSQQDVLSLTRSCLNAMLALQEEPQSVHLWQQVFQVSDFLFLRHQPHFLLALGRFVERHALSGECLLTLAEACSKQMRRSPFFAGLAGRMPEYDTSQAWPPPELFAGFLLQGNAQDFFEGSRSKLFFLLERTAENFRHSSQRHPWDYVFATPQFPLVKHDSLFLERLMAFPQGRDLPLQFWQSLHDAYLEDFLKLDDAGKSPQLWRLRELVRRRLMEMQDAQEAARRPRFRLSPPLLGAVSVLYLAGTLWLCFQEPFIGIPLLLAPLAFLFF